jgi:predicted nucleotidyltransferase
MERFIGHDNSKEDIPEFKDNAVEKSIHDKIDADDSVEISIEDFINKEIHSITEDVLLGKKSILDATLCMNELVFDVVNKVANGIISGLDLDKSNLPFAIFVFGSPSRNLMLPNSDLDIGLVFSTDCPENVKALLNEKILSLPFDKIDIAGWHSIDDMKKENCLDMIEYSKATDAKFMVGNQDISREYTELIRDKDTALDRSSRFITEFGLFHKHDYIVKRTGSGPNLKYDFGASRDIIFLDWFYIMNNEGNQARSGSDEPFFLRCLDDLLKNNKISLQEYDQLKKDIEIILLIKFTLRSKYTRTNDELLLHLSSYSLYECYAEAKNAFQNVGINSADELLDKYYASKLILDGLVTELYKQVAASNPELSEIWNIAKTTTKLDGAVMEILSTGTWYELMPFAVISKSPEILEFIVDRIHNLSGYEYILRIISENVFINDVVRQKLLDSNLEEKFKKKLVV